jgi:hypothetical protein
MSLTTVFVVSVDFGDSGSDKSAIQSAIHSANTPAIQRPIITANSAAFVTSNWATDRKTVEPAQCTTV